jgi:hypothetical protein
MAAKEEQDMRYLLLSTVAAAALVAGTAGAQMSDQQRLEPQKEQSGGQGATERAPRQVGPGQDSPKGQAQDQQGQTQGQTQDQPRGSAQTQDRGPSAGSKDRDLSTTQKQDPMPRAQDQAPSKQRTTGTEHREPRGQALDERAGKKQPGTAQKTDQGVSGQNKSQAKTQQPGRTDAQTDTQARTGEGGAKLSERQHTTIQQSFQRERNLNVVSRSNINVSVSIGATIPRSVRLAPLPASIVAIVPQFRSFHYFVVEEEIVIVHPRTFRVVEVIPLRGSGQARVATGSRSTDRVQLSGAQRARILSYAASDCTTVLTQTDFDLAVGATIPQQIELCPFEDTVVSEVSVLRPYRFFLVQDQVVLVDPRDHTIVEVIR